MMTPPTDPSTIVRENGQDPECSLTDRYVLMRQDPFYDTADYDIRLPRNSVRQCTIPKSGIEHLPLLQVPASPHGVPSRK